MEDFCLLYIFNCIGNSSSIYCMHYNFFICFFFLFVEMDGRKLVVIQSFCWGFMFIFFMYMYVAWQRRNERGVRNRITRNTELRTSFIDSLLDNDVTCISQLRMDRRTFVILCRLLRQDGYVKRDGTVTLEEQVCIFLHIIAHHTKNRTIISRFYRSGETISRYFNSVLNGVLRLHSILLRHPEPVSDNCSDDRWKMFKNCLGALDGTYIKVKVPEIDKPRYRTRKGEIATNVLGVCNPNMEFIFVLPGWEGSASDSRVLRDAISRPNGLKVPTAMEAGGSSNDNRWGESRRTWSRGEEEALLVLLDEAVASGQRCDTGAFKPGTLNMIERKLAEMCPNSGLRATPHIESKLKKWKKQYGIIYDMLNKSGFGWNDTLKCVEIDSDDAWKAYVQSNPSAKSWRDKPFPIYERLANIFGKDRATGHGAQTPIDLVNDINMEPDNDQFDDVGSPMSINQTHSQLPTQSQLRGKRKAQSKDVDIVSGLNNVADKFIDKLATQLDKLEKSDINYPQYLAMELDRLGFPITDNLKISKAMRSDPSNVEVFKIIKTDAQKIEFARGFLDN
ncbi:uncharacterized protein LOC107429887 isoform X3 [Ziziphus jujuba]|uniref:Uncharacterized protein LOC107429887 isoform X3 n=1 Tax=Ziziphus jujuba TaxID=326968 RepID=A0ABM4ADB4_ZIZJJ|nr:uncharacterized protein LOC107429887 isoform X3 [Ziziphus jujuba]